MSLWHHRKRGVCHLNAASRRCTRRNKGLGKPTEIRKKDIGKYSGSLARAQQGFCQMTLRGRRRGTNLEMNQRDEAKVGSRNRRLRGVSFRKALP